MSRLDDHSGDDRVYSRFLLTAGFSALPITIGLFSITDYLGYDDNRHLLFFEGLIGLVGGFAIALYPEIRSYIKEEGKYRKCWKKEKDKKMENEPNIERNNRKKE